MRGSVTGLQARLTIVFRLPGQPDLPIEFVLDTGFAGALTLPPLAIAAMGLPHVIDINTNLADDSAVSVPAHKATVIWDGREVDVAVLALGRRPLLGTALLDGYRLEAEFQDGGPVNITALP